MSGLDLEIFFCTPVQDQAVFRKIINNAKKSKVPGKGPNINIKADGATPGTSAQGEAAQAFERRKQEWQHELDSMSDFLLLKSTEEQKDEGVHTLVDTAFIDDREGLPVLKAVFDVHYFRPSEVFLSVDEKEHKLILDARCLDDRPDRVYRKTMRRTVDIPAHVYSRLMHCSLSDAGILTVEMPFHLPPQRRPHGPNVVPILDDSTDGRRKIRLGFMLGKEFTPDDIKVERDGDQGIRISACYDAEVGKYGQMRNKRELRRDYKLPATLKVDTVKHSLSPDGKLYVEIMLQKESPYKCKITTEDWS